MLYLLTGALLVIGNWNYLSPHDLRKIAISHGVFAETRKEQIKGILKSQIQIFQELFEKEEEENKLLYKEFLDDNQEYLNVYDK